MAEAVRDAAIGMFVVVPMPETDNLAFYAKCLETTLPVANYRGRL